MKSSCTLAALLAATLMAGAPSLASAVTIDSFTTNQTAVADPPGGVGTVVTGGADILGTRRNLSADLIFGAGPATASVAGGVLSLVVTATTPDSRGEAVVVWDGDTTAGNLNHTGLGGQNLTTGNHSGLRVVINGAPAGAEVVFDVYTDAGNYSRGALRVASAVASPTSFFLGYEDFGLVLGDGADFTNVGAIVMTVRATEATVTVDLVETVGPTVSATKVDLTTGNAPISTPQAPGTTMRYRVVISNTGGTATGTTLSDTIDGNTTLQPGTLDSTPVATDDTYSTFGNVGKAVLAASGLLSNDSDPDGSGGLTVDTAPSPVTTALGGTATLSADGSFTYEPPPGVGRSVDTFPYTLLDGEGNSDAGLVKIAIGQRVWFVDDAHPGANVGTLSNPFIGLTGTNLNGAGGSGDVDGPGDILFVFAGTYTGIELEADQMLIGEGEGLTLEGMSLVAAGVHPVHANAGGAGIVLASNNVVRGVNVGNTTGAGLSGANFGTLTLTNVGISGTGPALNLSNGTANATFNSLSRTSSASTAVTLNTVVAALTAAGGTSLSGVTGTGIVLTGVTGTLSLGATTISATAGGLDVSGGSPTVNHSSLAITTSAGFGFRATSGTFNISGSSNTIAATGGAAADLTGVNLGGGATFSTVSSTNSAGKGLNLDTVTGSFVANGGSLTGAAGNAFDLNAGNSTVTYAGSITHTANAFLAEVTGRTGGTATLSGNLSGTSNSNGINVASNSGGTITFSGTTKTLNTGADTAVSLATNNGATINFTGGGLDIDTTSGVGFNATGGATAVTVQGSGNSITSTTGTALNVASTTIGASGLTFQSIASNGGTNGIVLNNSGANGGLTVTGTGSAGSGGTIQNKTGDAVQLQNATGVSLSRMILDNNDGSGIFGDDLSNLSLIDSTVSNNGDTAGGTEGNLRFNELLGTCVISGSNIFGSIADNIRMTPASGTLTSLTISGTTIGPGAAGNGLSIVSTGTAVMNVTLNGSSIIQNHFASGVLTTVNGTSLNLTVDSSTFRDNNIGFDFGNGINSDVTAVVTNNVFLRHASNAINLVTDAGSTNAAAYRATISGNQIGDATVDSGSVNTFGIAGDFRGDVDAVVSITNNVIRHTDQEGIFIQGRLDNDADAEVGLLDLTLRDNSVANIDDNSAFPFVTLYGTRVESRNTYNLCLDIFSNTSTSVGGLEHFRARQRDTSTFRVERLALGAQNAATMASHLIAQNDAGSTASATVATSFTGVADGTCRTP